MLYSEPYCPKTNAIESWLSQFKHYFKHDETGITFSELKKSVKKAIGKIQLNSYLNYMKYAYKNKNVRKYTEKYSSRRKQLKSIRLNFFIIIRVTIIINDILYFDSHNNKLWFLITL